MKLILIKITKRKNKEDYTYLFVDEKQYTKIIANAKKLNKVIIERISELYV